MKQIKRTVDDHLPKWLHSRFLSAVNYIWEVKGNTEESIRRVHAVDNSGQFTAEEMSWIMMLLTIPKLQNETQIKINIANERLVKIKKAKEVDNEIPF